jgi:hypothetical protein
MTALRWQQIGRANFRADDGDGGYYTIDRFKRTWVKIHVYCSASGPEGKPHTRPVPWMRGDAAKHTLAEAKASCQHDAHLEERSEA